MFRKALLGGLAAAVTAMIVAGVTMFLVRGGARAAETGMGPCAEDSSSDCIPNLKADDLLGALKARGHYCTDYPGGTVGCELNVGQSRFSVGVETNDGGISRLSATVLVVADSEPSERALTFLRWVAGVPFAHDRQSANEIDAWLTTQLAEEKTVDATIAGYRYHLASQPGRETRSIDLDIMQSWG